MHTKTGNSNRRNIIVLATAWFLTASITACTNTVGGVAISSTTHKTTHKTTHSQTPATSTSVTPTPVTPLPASSSGYVYIATTSGQTRCQISASAVGCESAFTNPPRINGAPANGVQITAEGTLRWTVGNLGAIPTTSIDNATYRALGWSIEATTNTIRFTHDMTGHGMLINAGKVDSF